MDASRRHHRRSASIGCTMRHKRSNIVMDKSKRLENYSITVAECEAVCKVILMTIQISVSWIIILSNSQ